MISRRILFHKIGKTVYFKCALWTFWWVVFSYNKRVKTHDFQRNLSPMILIGDQIMFPEFRANIRE